MSSLPNVSGQMSGRVIIGPAEMLAQTTLAKLPGRQMREAGIRQTKVALADGTLRRDVALFMRRGASRTEAEEVAGRGADGVIGWPCIFTIFCKELDNYRRLAR